MSADTLEMVITRAMVDSRFREMLRDDTEHALSEYDFTPEEREALHQGDVERLKKLGVRDDIAQAARTGIKHVTLS